MTLANEGVLCSNGDVHSLQKVSKSFLFIWSMIRARGAAAPRGASCRCGERCCVTPGERIVRTYSGSLDVLHFSSCMSPEELLTRWHLRLTVLLIVAKGLLLLRGEY